MIRDYPPYLDYPIARKPVTNADHIRSMSDEELAESFCDKRLTKKMWLDWLKQPYKEDNNG